MMMPELVDTLLPVAIVSTMLFEIAGPICKRSGPGKAGEVGLAWLGR